MGLVQRLKKTLPGRSAKASVRFLPDREHGQLQVQVPNPLGETPLLSVKVGYGRRQGVRGEYTRLVTRVETTLPGLQPAARVAAEEPADTPAAGPAALAGARPFRLSRRATDLLPRLATRKLETEIDLRTTTLPLSGGAQELASRALQRFGIVPHEAAEDLPANMPAIRHWHGRYERPDGGRSLLSVFYGSHLPMAGPERGGRFNFAATVLATLHPKRGGN